jgi:hypothetical protein
MIKPLIVKNIVPIGIIDNELIVQKRTNLGVLNKEFKFIKKSKIPDTSIISLLFNTFSITRRFFRKGAHNLCCLDGTNYLVFNKAIYIRKKNESKYSFYFNNYLGSRPLNFNCSENEILFGEYHSNQQRTDETNIYQIRNNESPKIVYTFKKNEIRHVHNCIFDKHRKGWWILTGDNDSESNIYFYNKRLSLIAGGSQKYRAVEIILESEKIFIPSDTPFQKNKIRIYHNKSEVLEDVFQVNGSVFHAKKIKDIYFISTVTEPSEINKSKKAILYGSLDGINWSILFEAKKDFIPIKFQKYFRYSELKILENLFLDKFVIIEGRALQNISNGMLVFDISEIKSFLSTTLRSKNFI